MDPQPAPILRKMEIGDIIDTAIRIYRHNFFQLLSIIAPVYVPALGLQTVLMVEILGAPQKMGGSEIPWARLAGLLPLAAGVLLLMAVLLPLANGACCVAVSELYLGRRISVREAYGRVFPILGRLLWTFILVGLFTLGAEIAGLPVLLIGALVAAVWMSTLLLFAWPVAVIEGTWGLDALRRSRDLVQSGFWRILGTWIVLTLLVGLAAQAVALPLVIVCGIALGLGEASQTLVHAITQGIGSAMSLLLTPITIIGTVLLYYDTRIRKEGFDLQVMAAALGHDPTAYKAAPPVADLPPLWGAPNVGFAPKALGQPEPWVPPPSVVLPRPGEERLADLPPLPSEAAALAPPDQPQQGTETNDAAADSQSHTPY